MTEKKEALEKIYSPKLKEIIKQIQTIEPERDHSDSFWRFYFPVNSKEWECLFITKYQTNYYFSFAGSRFDLCFPGEAPNGQGKPDWYAKEIKWIVDHVPRCIAEIKKGTEGAYRNLYNKLPIKYRKGLVPRKAVLLNVHDIYRPEKELGVKDTQELVRWIEKNPYSKPSLGKTLTLNKYLKYCKVAYEANAKKLGITEDLSGFELYKRYADNRHEGLLDIKKNSYKALDEWYRLKRGRGGHPWEIYCGGNTTHISLGITQAKEYYITKDDEPNEYTIFLNGGSTSRLVETARIALAFIRNKMPFVFGGAQEMREKLLALDNIGIVPDWYSLHRANQDYLEGQKVYDCMHWRDLTGAERRRLLPYCCWFPIKAILPPVPIRGPTR